MSNNRDRQSADSEREAYSFSRLLPSPPQSHTHVQQVAACIHVDVRGASGC